MGTITIADDILAPRNKIVMRYRGKNPFVVVPMAFALIRDTLKVSSKDMFEKDIRWDATGDSKDFYCIWYGKHEEDRWTETYIKVSVQGAQASSDKSGWVNVTLEGRVVTKITYANFLQKSIWFIYNRGFYYKQRRAYIEQGKEFIQKIREAFLSALNIYVEAEGEGNVG